MSARTPRLIATLIACAIAAPADAAAGRAIMLRAADGAPVTGTIWEPSQRPAPAVLLLPMQTRTRDDWQPVGTKLADAGVLALAIELRGFGGGAASGPLDLRVDSAPALADVAAAVDFLASRADVRPGAIGIAGGSMGANLAVLAAAGDLRVRSIVLLSPGLDYRGLRIEQALRKYAERPALLVASARDPYALRSIRDLVKDPPGTREQRVVEAMAHGMMLLSREPDLPAAIVDWFKRTLP